MIGITTRPVTFSYTDQHKVSRDSHRAPVGTEVYIGRERKDGTVEIRLPGTLFTQSVYWGTVSCP